MNILYIILALISAYVMHLPTIAIVILSVLKWVLNYIQPFALEILKYHLSQREHQAS